MMLEPPPLLSGVELLHTSSVTFALWHIEAHANVGMLGNCPTTPPLQLATTRTVKRAPLDLRI